jgi:hypothetical protein
MVKGERAGLLDNFLGERGPAIAAERITAAPISVKLIMDFLHTADRRESARLF